MSVGVVRAVDPPKAENAKAKPEPAGLAPINSELFRGVRVPLEVRLGQAVMTVEEMMALKSGSIVTLETRLVDHLEIYLNGTLIARGEVVAVGDKYGVRIVDIAPSL
jgi:flagellar motor switch protein FliN/FliY